MNNLRILLPLLLLAPLLAAPLASAHVEGFSQSRTLNVGPYLVFLSPQPDTIFANATLTLTAQIARNDTGAGARGVSATVVVGGPGEYSKRLEMREDRKGTGLFAAVLLPQRGTYSFRIILQDANGTYEGDTELEAYPDIPYRIRSADAEQDFYVGEKATLRFEVVNRTSLRPTDAVPDLRMRLEHWSDDHTQLLGEDEVVLKDAGEGLWETDYTFRDKGMYHLKFTSGAGGFTYADVPILHLYATPPYAAGGDEPGQNKVPGPALGIVLVALAGALLARRR